MRRARKLSSFSTISNRAWARGMASPTPQQCDGIRVALQGGRVFGGDAQGRQFAKTGVHPVDRNVASSSSTDRSSSSLDPRTGSAVQRDGQFFAVDARQLRQGGLAGNKGMSGQRTPPIMRWCRG